MNTWTSIQNTWNVKRACDNNTGYLSPFLYRIWNCPLFATNVKIRVAFWLLSVWTESLVKFKCPNWKTKWTKIYETLHSKTTHILWNFPSEVPMPRCRSKFPAQQRVVLFWSHPSAGNLRFKKFCSKWPSPNFSSESCLKCVGHTYSANHKPMLRDQSFFTGQFNRLCPSLSIISTGSTDILILWSHKIYTLYILLNLTSISAVCLTAETDQPHSFFKNVQFCNCVENK